jgi:F-type H+-transporting ATPase subunit b
MIKLDLATIIFQVVNFLVMVALLYRFLLKPVLAKSAARTAEKERIMREIEEERERSTAARLQLEERLSHAEEEADEIINSAQEKVEAAQKALLQEAYEEAERIRHEAHEDAQRFWRRVMLENYDRLLDTIMELSGAAIAAAAPPELHDNMVNRVHDGILGLGQRDMARVEDFRRSLADRAPTAEISTFRPLTPAQQSLLANRLAALADRRVSMEITLDPTLGSGMRLRIGDLIIDSSIAGDLAASREGVAASLRKELRGN